MLLKHCYSSNDARFAAYAKEVKLALEKTRNLVGDVVEFFAVLIKNLLASIILHSFYGGWFVLGELGSILY